MISKYEGNIKVVGEDQLCFAVNPRTLEPLGPAVYHPWWKINEGEICRWTTSQWQMEKRNLVERTPPPSNRTGWQTFPIDVDSPQSELSENDNGQETASES